MGNNQTVNVSKKSKDETAHKTNEKESRRMSTPGIHLLKTNKKRQFFKKSFLSIGKSHQAIPPKIQINGEESAVNDNVTEEEEYSLPDGFKNENKKRVFKHSVSIDYPYYNKAIIKTTNSIETDDDGDLEHYKGTASSRRMQFLNSSGSLTVRSLDSGSGNGSTDIDFEMKPFSRTRSYSPLRYIRSTSQRSLIASDPFLAAEQKFVLVESWKVLKDKVTQIYTGSFFRFFGICVFERLFKKMPELFSTFNITDETNINTLPDDHVLNRHATLLASLVDLAIRNIDQLETELGPALIIYGQRHAHFPNSKQFFSECVIRCLCAQVVCTVAELLLDDLEANTVNAWVDILRYMGRSLLTGFDNEK
uniref:GLOBIN domain-containing protein n=1 Tax=Parastrongyloides trichosuri TaxID=131310 RepID=A0A0N4ZAE2_PARTI